MQLFLSVMMDYSVMCCLDCLFEYLHEIGFGCNVL